MMGLIVAVSINFCGSIRTRLSFLFKGTTEVRSPPDPLIVAGSDILYEYLIKKKMV